MPPTYSVQDVKDVVAYGNERGIRVIPEIDVPGESCSLLLFVLFFVVVFMFFVVFFVGFMARQHGNCYIAPEIPNNHYESGN